MAKKNDIEMYSTNNEWKSVIVERFIRTVKNKIYKYMTSVSKICIFINIYNNTYIYNKYNNTYYSTIKMKPVDVKSNTYINFSKDINYKDLNLVMIIEYQNIKIFLPKLTFQIGLKMFLWLKKLKILFGGHKLLVTLKAKKLLEHIFFFLKKKKNEFRVEKGKSNKEKRR